MRKFEGWKKIPESDPGFIERQEWRAEVGPYQESHFGGELRKLYQARDLLTSEKVPANQREKFQKRFDALLEQEKEKFEEVLDRDDGFEFVMRLFERAFERNNLLEEMISEGILPYHAEYDSEEDWLDLDGEEDYPFQLLRAYRDDRVSDEMLAKLFTNYAEDFEQRNGAFRRERLPEYKAQFMRDVERFIEETGISISVETIRERMKLVDVRLADPTFMTFKEKNGHFSPDENLIEMSSELNIELGGEKKTFDHEMFHAVSGRIVYEVPGGGWTDVSVQSAGFSIMGKMYWLNEGVTERLAWKIQPEGMKKRVQRKVFETYRREQALVAALLESGEEPIPEKLMYDAYFERSDDEERVNWRASFREFSRAVSDRYGRSFLSRLNKFVTNEQGKTIRRKVEQATELLKAGRFDEI